MGVMPPLNNCCRKTVSPKCTRYVKSRTLRGRAAPVSIQVVCDLPIVDKIYNLSVLI